MDGEAIYCEGCKMWLNGRAAWDDHAISKKHNKNKPKPNKKGKSSEDENIPQFCEELCASTIGCTHIIRMLEVTSDFSPSLLSQWGLEAFPLPWLTVEEGSVVYDCRHVKDPNIPFIFGRMGKRCGFIPKHCVDNLPSTEIESWMGTAAVSQGSAGSDFPVYDLECAICQDTFQVPVHLVRAIPCGHHACLD